jgi:uncharacterized protein (DUF1697 family)
MIIISMRYVCLLRGINVGGNRKVSMSDLRSIFEKLGYSDIVTYINSGNVVFSSGDEPEVNTIEKALKAAFGFDIPALIISADRVRAIAVAIPGSWQNDTQQKSDVIYLLPDVDIPETIDELAHKPEIETVMYVPGALLYNISRTKQSRSSLLKLMGKPLYQRMTIRNINTTRKLAELCV